AHVPWWQNHARRLVAECAVADGWGTPAEWLATAAAFFDAAGQAPIASACRAVLRRAGAPVPRLRGTAVAHGLAAIGVTPREADVLACVEEGLANRDIAARLYLSPRTVE